MPSRGENREPEGIIKSGDYESKQDDVLGARPVIWVKLN